MKKIFILMFLVLVASVTFAQLGGGVTKTGVQTLTNKTLTLPKINENVQLTVKSSDINTLSGIDTTKTIAEQFASKPDTSEILTQAEADSRYPQLSNSVVGYSNAQIDSVATSRGVIIAADTTNAGNTFISSVTNKLYFKTPAYWYASDMSDSIKRQIPLWDNLVHYYKFDGATGNEDSRGTAPLTFYGTPTMGGAGKSGECFAPDGTDDYATIPATNNFITGEHFSVSFWLFEDTQPNTNPHIIGQGTTDAGGTNVMSLELQSTPEIRFRAAQLTPSIYAYRTMTGMQNTWVHIAAVRDGSEMFIYRNGVANTTLKDITSGTMTDPATLIYLAKANSTGTLFTGKIDELGMFNCSLTPAKVASLATGITFTP